MREIPKYYKEKIQQLETEEKRQRKTLRLFGLARLFLFTASILVIFMLIPKSAIVGIPIFIISIVLFLAAVKIYTRKKDNNLHTNVLLDINRNELKALKHDYSAFGNGEESIDQSHPYSYDMDLFGEGSVFQYLNRTVTVKGREYLAGLLMKETLDEEMIINRQATVKELSSMAEHLQNFRASGSLHKDYLSDITTLREWIDKPPHYSARKGFIFISRAFPLALLLSIALAFLLPVFKGISIFIFLLNLFVTGTQLSYINREHGLISKRLETLKKYAFLLSVIEKGKYAGKRLARLYNSLISEKSSASRSILSLSKIVSALDNRLNVIAAIFLEGFLLWDINCMLKLERWRKHTSEYFDDWMDAMAEFDAMTSLATYAFNHPSYAYPEYSQLTVLNSEGLGHFLIPAKQRITNDFTISNKGELTIITGANMAGKSTFLRTIATNLIVAMAGAPVCAKKFSFKPMPIFSSMRTSDSLNKNESYFYAELKRLKEMLDRLKSGDDLFIILDEILKGTNSADKHKGSRSALMQIMKYKGTGIIATHDLELAKLEDDRPDKIRNLCFEIEINKSKISFDYKLREGKTTKMNASLLMQQMGILEL